MSEEELRDLLKPHIGLDWTNEYTGKHIVPLMIRWLNESGFEAEACFETWDNIVWELLQASNLVAELRRKKLN